MNKFVPITVAMTVAVLCSALIAAAQPVAEPNNGPSRTATSDSLLVPPKEDGPVVVRASFEFHDINEINDEHQTFQFTGVLTLRWHDKRQAFDPAAVGVDEKVYQGAYQVDEISPGWFPQLVLVNGSGSYEKQGSVLRMQPDGTLTLTEKVVATAKTEFNFFRFPFDRQRLEAVFELLGFDNSQVVLQVEPETTDLARSEIRIPQWSITGISMSTQDRPASYAGHRGCCVRLGREGRRATTVPLRQPLGHPSSYPDRFAFFRGILDGQVIVGRSYQRIVHRDPYRRRLPARDERNPAPDRLYHVDERVFEHQLSHDGRSSLGQSVGWQARSAGKV